MSYEKETDKINKTGGQRARKSCDVGQAGTKGKERERENGRWQGERPSSIPVGSDAIPPAAAHPCASPSTRYVDLYAAQVLLSSLSGGSHLHDPPGRPLPSSAASHRPTYSSRAASTFPDKTSHLFSTTRATSTCGPLLAPYLLILDYQRYAHFSPTFTYFAYQPPCLPCCEMKDEKTLMKSGDEVFS